MGFILRFQWWLLSKKVTSLLYWKWHHAHTSIGDGRKCQYRSNGRRYKGFKSKSLSKTSCLLESRMLDEATVPLCLPRKSGKTQAILQSSETAAGDTAAKEKRRSNSLNISTNASFSIWKAQCHRVSNSRARELKTDPKKSKVIVLPQLTLETWHTEEWIMKILGSLISSHLPHLGLLFLMIVEAIVEAGLTERSKQGLFGNGTGGDNVGESLEDKLRQHLASAANTTRVRVALHHHTHPPILPFSEILLNPAVQNNPNLKILLRKKAFILRAGRSGQHITTVGCLVGMESIGVSSQWWIILTGERDLRAPWYDMYLQCENLLDGALAVCN